MSLHYGELNPNLIEDKTQSPPPRLSLHVYLIGILAGIFTSLAFLPQVIKTIQSRTSSSLTWLTLIICIIGQSLWAIYGSLSHDKILILFSIIALFLYLCLISSKILF